MTRVSQRFDRFRSLSLSDLLKNSPLLHLVVMFSYVYITSALLSLGPNLSWIIGPLVGFSVYGLNDLTDETEDTVNQPTRKHIAWSHQWSLLALVIGSYLIALGLAIHSESIGAIVLTILPGLVGLLYSVSWLPFDHASRLKDVFLINTVLVAGTIAVAVTYLPLLLSSTSVSAEAAAAVAVFFFFRTLVTTTTCDVPDIEGDQQRGVQTIPVKCGIRQTQRLLYGLDIVSIGFLLILELVLTPIVSPLVLLPALMASLGITYLLHEETQHKAMCIASDAHFPFMAFLVFVVSIGGGVGVYTGSLVTVIVMFLLCFWTAKQEGDLGFYLTLVVYGLLLEKAAMMYFQTYFYSDQHILTLYSVPIQIGLAWAAIIYAGYVTAVNFRADTWAVPVFTAVYVLHVDLAIDAIAVRVPFWTWTYGHWFGVPLGNFLAWYLVALLFTGSYLVLKNHLSNPLLLGGGVIISSTALLLVLLELWMVLTAKSVPRMVGILFLVIGGSLGLLVFRANISLSKMETSLWKPFVAVLLIHLFYLEFMFRNEIYQEEPILLGVSLSMLLIGILVHSVPAVYSVDLLAD